MNISALLNLTIVEINVSHEDDEITFKSSDNRTFRMFHSQDCCEDVSIESIVGELSDLLGSPILLAEESTSAATPDDFKHDYEPESQTWTFYKLATIKGYVDIRWFGSSNGYYSESVDFKEVAA